ncbi:MAG: hypothetical protein NC043_07735 [Muribaculaceae bacterium]|nr:hypothetical protein [Muribaculaceae bacterium]
MKKKKLLSIATAAVLGILVLFGIAVIYSQYMAQSNISVEKDEPNLGLMPLTLDNVVEIAPGLRFRIDTGSSSCTISREYLDLLKKRGYKVDSILQPRLNRMAIGSHRFTNRRYTVELPVHASEVVTDSTGVRTDARILPDSIINTLHEVDFVLAGPTEMPRLGIKFLKRFKMEFLYDIHAIRLWRVMPDDYEYLADMRRERTLFWDGRRFVKLKVNGVQSEFFVNTSMPRVSLLLPEGMAADVDGVTVFSDSIPSLFGGRPCIIDYKVWSEWGNRAGNNVGFYAKYGEEPFAINPFFFLKQNAVFDFTDNKVYLQPRSARIRSSRENDVFAIMPRHKSNDSDTVRTVK